MFSWQGVRKVVASLFGDPRLDSQYFRDTALIVSLQSLGR